MRLGLSSKTLSATYTTPGDMLSEGAAIASLHGAWGLGLASCCQWPSHFHPIPSFECEEHVSLALDRMVSDFKSEIFRQPVFSVCLNHLSPSSFLGRPSLIQVIDTGDTLAFFCDLGFPIKIEHFLPIISVVHSSIFGICQLASLMGIFLLGAGKIRRQGLKQKETISTGTNVMLDLVVNHPSW